MDSPWVYFAGLLVALGVIVAAAELMARAEERRAAKKRDQDDSVPRPEHAAR